MGADMRNATLRRLRLASQILFFALFVFLLVRTEFQGAIRSAALDVRIPWPVGWFLEADPLVALATALSTGTLYRHLVWPSLPAPLHPRRPRILRWMCPLGRCTTSSAASSRTSSAARGSSSRTATNGGRRRSTTCSSRSSRWRSWGRRPPAPRSALVHGAVDVGGGAAGVQRGHRAGIDTSTDGRSPL